MTWKPTTPEEDDAFRLTVEQVQLIGRAYSGDVAALAEVRPLICEMEAWAEQREEAGR